MNDRPTDAHADGVATTLSAAGHARREAILATAHRRQRRRTVHRRVRRGAIAVVALVAGGLAISTMFERASSTGAGAPERAVARGERPRGGAPKSVAEAPARIARVASRSFRVESVGSIGLDRIEIAPVESTRVVVETTLGTPRPIGGRELADALAALPAPTSFVWTARGPIRSPSSR